MRLMKPGFQRYLDDENKLEAGVCCVQCQYDLRGQSYDGNCPECGCLILPDLEENALLDTNRAGHMFLLLAGVILFPTLPVLAYWVDSILLNNKDWLSELNALIYAVFGALAAAQLSLIGCLYSAYWGKALFCMFLCLAVAYFGVIVALVAVVLII